LGWLKVEKRVSAVMKVATKKWHAVLSWLFVGTLFVLCGVFGVLQYRWIGDVSFAAHERLRLSLQGSLNRLSQDFDAEITAACAALLPARPPLAGELNEEDYATRYMKWKASARHNQLLRSVAIAVPQDSALILRTLDLERGVFVTAEWPPAWTSLRDRLAARSSRKPREFRRPPGPPGEDQGLLVEFPRFTGQPGGPPGTQPDPPGPREAEWVIVEFDLDYIQAVVLPDLLQRHLGSGGSLDYEVEVVTKGNPPSLIYQSDGDRASRIGTTADASVSLFPRPGPGGPREGERGGGFRAAPGRWLLSVRHRAGSLEAVVARARRRNLAVTAAILLSGTSHAKMITR
jgi:hypothetical protein